MDTRHRTFRIPAELDEKLEERAQKLDRSASWVILECLRNGLEDGYGPSLLLRVPNRKATR
jgi:predicted transcriptional regulator